MQFLIIFSVLFVVVYGINPDLLAAIKAHVKHVGGECKAEIGASDDDLAPLLAHSSPTTEKGKCFLACMNKKNGCQDASGKIDKDHILAGLEKMKPLDEEYYNGAMKVASACLGSVTDQANECDTATAMHACMLVEMKKAGLPTIDFND